MKTDQAKPSLEEIWRKYDAVEERLSAPLSKRMLDLAGLTAGMQVIDLATGRGEPAIPAARRVLPNGSVLGVDSDRSVLRIAQEKAALAGASNLTLKVADIETLAGVPENHFNVALARWALMYLQHPIQALEAIRRTLIKGGVLVAAVWINPCETSFFELPRAAMERIGMRQPKNHDEPGTFYYSELSRLTGDLEAAGFFLSHSEVLQVEVMEVSSDEALIAWARTFGMWRLLQYVSSRDQSTWERALIAEAEQYRTKDGKVRLSGWSRLIIAGQAEL